MRDKNREVEKPKHKNKNRVGQHNNQQNTQKTAKTTIFVLCVAVAVVHKITTTKHKKI